MGSLSPSPLTAQVIKNQARRVYASAGNSGFVSRHKETFRIDTIEGVKEFMEWFFSAPRNQKQVLHTNFCG